MWVRVALAPPIRAGRVSTTASEGFAAARSASGDETAGIQGVVANPRLAAALGATSGVLVLDVQPRSHADSLGIRPGDVLVSLNGNPVVSVATERTALKRLRAATTARPTTLSAVIVRARVRRTLEFGAPRAVAPQPRYASCSSRDVKCGRTGARRTIRRPRRRVRPAWSLAHTSAT
jgi:predicted metalloprotease with PDZ domain